MSGALTTVVRVADRVRDLYGTVRSLRQQWRPPDRIVIVAEPQTPSSTFAWIESFARSRDCTFLQARTSSAGAVWNAGLADAADGYAICAEAGDVFDPSFTSACEAWLDRDPHLTIVSADVLLVGPGPRRDARPSPGPRLSDLLGSDAALHRASMFRIDCWRERPFDEALPVLAEYDFFLHVLARGGTADVVPRPLIISTIAATPETADDEVLQARERTLATIVDRHQETFRADPVSALYGRERRLQELAIAYDAQRLEFENRIHERDMLRREIEAAKMPDTILPMAELFRPDRTAPVSRDWGYERGGPIDRPYIERFLEQHRADIRGVVLEVQEPDYTRRFGADRVTRSDVVDLNHLNERATVVADFRAMTNVADDTYDCIILTQTIHVIDDMTAVAAECARVLKPGGVLLATLPAASRVCVEYGRDGDFWRVTEAGARALFGRAFAAADLDVQAHGNVLVNAAFLFGLGRTELDERTYSIDDPYYPLIVTVRARQRRADRSSGVRRARTAAREAAILLYHRVAEPRSDVHGLSISAGEFRRQMQHLAAEYRPMRLADIAEQLDAGTLPAGAVAVTFDDGYLDNLTVASPILEELGIPATFFVTTDRLDAADYQYWWDRLEDAMPQQGRSFGDAYAKAYAEIIACGAEAREAALARVIGASAAPAESGRRRMTGGEIIELASRPGHDIGAHSVHHLLLPPQPVDVQHREIVDSRLALESLLGRSVSAFAYPFGGFDHVAVNAAAAAGFTIAVTCGNATATRSSGLLTLPRFDPLHRRLAFEAWLADRITPA